MLVFTLAEQDSFADFVGVFYEWLFSVTFQVLPVSSKKADWLTAKSIAVNMWKPTCGNQHVLPSSKLTNSYFK